MTLFGQDDPAVAAAPSAQAAGPFAGVAIEQSVDRVLDYSIPPKLVGLLRVGQRVRVPLGRNNKPAIGYVVSISDTTSYPNIKPISGIDDDRVLVDGPMLELARWMSRYYCAPLGTVIETIIPSAVKKKVGLGYSQMVSLAKPREQAQSILEKTKAPKRRAILARLLQLEPGESIELSRLAGQAGVTVATVRRLRGTGLITIRSEPDLAGLTSQIEVSPADEPQIQLNADQQAVMQDLMPRVSRGGFSVNLLLGVTGSGKTEIYLRCIAEVVAQGRQAIVLVPEIALTPQTVRRFTARFPRVAILHSALSATQRHRFWQQISTGQADVVVGARSAVFAPLPRLGIIVVDEEHEASYKQDIAPRYHARDVAIKRAQLQGVPVLLGSATPSLESWQRVQSRAQQAQEPQSAGSYYLLRLPHRVRGLSLPHVELVDMRVVNRNRRGVHLLSPRLEYLLRNTIDAGQQAILLLNRRGYSNFVYCPSCQHLMQCKYCDTTMTYHRSVAAHTHSAKLAESVHAGQLHCHYCLAVNPLPEKCPQCGKLLSLFGLGTQRVEEEIARKFPELKFARVDSDSMRSWRDYEATLGRFARREIQVMLGTQLIAKGLDYPNVTLVGVISGDTALALPDFRAAERTFQLITQVAGRAGRGDAPGRVVLQTFLPDDPTIQAALKQDYEGFARVELENRKSVGLPPFTRMVRIVIRDQDAEKLNKRAEELAAQLSQATAPHGPAVAMRGPMPCAIGRIAGYFRSQIVLISPSAARLQNVLAAVREKGALARSERIAVDVDPVALL
ncbi:replication restart helicase PriA [Fontivita pretiosa]|uniref:replication restart helicase PriA n=1 Tax=Fontivita pretiosa TaxID=2989684 RepID=UPI003D1645EA